MNGHQEWDYLNDRPRGFKEPDGGGYETPIDTTVDRKGEWMHTSLGGRFWPADPRQSEIRVSDIGNGCALDCRYAGQGRVDRYYSVAEHQVHMARFVMVDRPNDPLLAMATLMHDAAEAYINDLNRATKHAVDSVTNNRYIGPVNAYSVIEKPLQEMILRKYGCWEAFCANKAYIKDIDCRIVPLEKAAIMRYPQPWAFDQYQPLPGVYIACWSPAEAKQKWCQLYTQLCIEAGLQPECWEI